MPDDYKARHRLIARLAESNPDLAKAVADTGSQRLKKAIASSAYQASASNIVNNLMSREIPHSLTAATGAQSLIHSAVDGESIVSQAIAVHDEALILPPLPDQAVLQANEAMASGFDSLIRHAASLGDITHAKMTVRLLSSFFDLYGRDRLHALYENLPELLNQEFKNNMGVFRALDLDRQRIENDEDLPFPFGGLKPIVKPIARVAREQQCDTVVLISQEQQYDTLAPAEMSLSVGVLGDSVCPEQAQDIYMSEPKANAEELKSSFVEPLLPARELRSPSHKESHQNQLVSSPKRASSVDPIAAPGSLLGDVFVVDATPNSSVVAAETVIELREDDILKDTTPFTQVQTVQGLDFEEEHQENSVILVREVPDAQEPSSYLGQQEDESMESSDVNSDDGLNPSDSEVIQQAKNSKLAQKVRNSAGSVKPLRKRVSKDLQKVADKADIRATKGGNGTYVLPSAIDKSQKKQQSKQHVGTEPSGGKKSVSREMAALLGKRDKKDERPMISLTNMSKLEKRTKYLAEQEVCLDYIANLPTDLRPPNMTAFATFFNSVASHQFVFLNNMRTYRTNKVNKATLLEYTNLIVTNDTIFVGIVTLKDTNAVLVIYDTKLNKLIICDALYSSDCDQDEYMTLASQLLRNVLCQLVFTTRCHMKNKSREQFEYPDPDFDHIKKAVMGASIELFAIGKSASTFIFRRASAVCLAQMLVECPEKVQFKALEDWTETDIAMWSQKVVSDACEYFNRTQLIRQELIELKNKRLEEESAAKRAARGGKKRNAPLPATSSTPPSSPAKSAPAEETKQEVTPTATPTPTFAPHDDTTTPGEPIVVAAAPVDDLLTPAAFKTAITTIKRFLCVPREPKVKQMADLKKVLMGALGFDKLYDPVVVENIVTLINHIQSKTIEFDMKGGISLTTQYAVDDLATTYEANYKTYPEDLTTLF